MRKVTKGNVTIKVRTPCRSPCLRLVSQCNCLFFGQPQLWDIGGQPRFRSMWERYCRGVSAIVYMVDAADTKPDKLDSCKQELHALLAKEQLAGIPVLVLGNKNDLPTAMGVEQIIEALELKAVSDREVCCYSISCKSQVNIDITLQWLTKHSKGGK